MIPIITQMYFRCTLIFFSFKKKCYKTLCPFSLIKPIIYQFYTNVPSIMIWYKMIKATKKKKTPPRAKLTHLLIRLISFYL